MPSAAFLVSNANYMYCKELAKTGMVLLGAIKNIEKSKLRKCSFLVSLYNNVVSVLSARAVCRAQSQRPSASLILGDTCVSIGQGEKRL
jgi:hypothetical protein